MFVYMHAVICKIAYAVIPPSRAIAVAEYVERSVSSILHFCAQKSKSINEAAVLVPFHRYLSSMRRELSQSATS